MPAKTFSEQLHTWLISKEPKTLQGLIAHFSEKSFAILFLILMAIPALPLPTGGVTHVFEIINMLLALELIAGLDKVWLPKRWRRLNLPMKLQNSTFPFLIKTVHKVERLSRPRLRIVFKNAVAIRIIGLLIFILTLFAFLAPPFSGLDTLPSLGVVLISLAMVLDDFILFLLGLVVGSMGIGLVIGIGHTLINLISTRLL
jgi:hypothetical protein